MIRLLFFAHLGEQIGEREVMWPNVPETVKQLKDEVEERYGISLGRVMTAVNEEYVRDEAPLHAGDTVAFIPPVSGG
ncbi:Molybdopterin converting factor, subunit 1 [Geobacillus thermoleovorans CCB_US3_UF5]|uniref:Molybdopterin synthase sulfur carrier subunit n=2 Tax=Geobacillus thermoleovorans group TaxID=1505648 RepID=U2WWK2_GEOKU|nr:MULTISPECIES: molybdopterin converting factor subunit 1 [Geobacillus]AEV18201.1 Molybdopterin converting factor, subunit 1 [Geobacillus thermoleovorans CCB_US3_UF5]QDY72471.1 molybdopterin converting factor subunit 1 [Geobacillus thermoleovorans]GAD15246.1 molybdopterin converting factor, subunit 1 [Geobacillus kaustophilus GBlys]